MNRAKDTYIIISYRTISLSHVSSLSHCCTHSQTEAFYQSYESSLTSLVTCVLCGFAHTMQLCPYPKEFSFCARPLNLCPLLPRPSFMAAPCTFDPTPSDAYRAVGYR